VSTVSERSLLAGVVASPKCRCGTDQTPFRFVGWSEPVATIECDQPIRLVRICCGERLVMRCNSHKAETCAPCALRYQRAVRQVAWHVPLNAPYVYLLTLTAPSHRYHYKGNGDLCECSPDVEIPQDEYLAQFNANASTYWTHFLKQLRRRARGIEYFRAVEIQQRGAIHYHVIIKSDDPLSLKAIRTLAVGTGWGHSVQLDLIDDVQRVAGYVAKYVTKAVSARSSVPWFRDVVDRETGEITSSFRPTFRAWSCSLGWGVSMKAVRYALFTAWLRHAGKTDDLPESAALVPDLILTI